jgi:probable F420-dependent oxidoreductase
MTNDLRARIGSFGFWVSRKRLPTDAAALREIGAELDDLGVPALWLGGSPTEDLSVPEHLLAGSGRLLVGTSILNIWTEDPAVVAASCHRLADAFGDRFVLGVGAGHAPAAEQTGQAYVRPLGRLRGYLDDLDHAQHPVPAGARMLAALGPRALELAAERSAGALPYLTTPEHTRQARQIMGSDPLLVPEHKVVLLDDPVQARAVGRSILRTYLVLPNYLNSWRRLGFTDEDFAGDGSDRLVDAVVAHGDADAVMGRLVEHLAAGGDHVAVQPLAPDGGLPIAQWRQLAAAFRDFSTTD